MSCGGLCLVGGIGSFLDKTNAPSEPESEPSRPATSNTEAAADQRSGTGSSRETTSPPPQPPSAEDVERARSNYEAAEVLASRGEWPDALAAHRRVAGEFPGTEWAEKSATRAKMIDECSRWMKLAEGSLEQGNPEAAARWFQKVLDAWPDSEFAPSARGGLRGAEAAIRPK